MNKDKPRFEVCDIVKCKKIPGCYGGVGWLENRIFKITEISEDSAAKEGEYKFIYWENRETIGGVYENSLELVAKCINNCRFCNYRFKCITTGGLKRVMEI